MTERVVDFRSSLFEDCLRILDESLSADARLPRSRLLALLAGDAYRLYALRLQNKVVGAALLYLSADLPFVLLDYIAIDSRHRNQGLGSALFRALAAAAYREKSSANWLFLEVDDDREGSQESRATSRRRIDFYQRLGAKLLVNLPYRFPCVDANTLPMRLMVYRLRPEAALSVADVTSAIEDTFLHIHRRNGADELLAWFKANRPPFLELK